MSNWCEDCIYNVGECASTKGCDKGSRKIIFVEEDFEAGRQIMLAREQIKKEGLNDSNV